MFQHYACRHMPLLAYFRYNVVVAIAATCVCRPSTIITASMFENHPSVDRKEPGPNMHHGFFLTMDSVRGAFVKNWNGTEKISVAPCAMMTRTNRDVYGFFLATFLHDSPQTTCSSSRHTGPQSWPPFSMSDDHNWYS